MSPHPVPSSATPYRADQNDLFGNPYPDNPVLSVLYDQLSAAGFASLKKLGLHMEKLIKEQQRKDVIRQEYFEIRAEKGTKEAFKLIMEAYNLEPDTVDRIIYPRIGK